MKLNRRNDFDADINFSLPGDGVNTWKPVSFKASFRSLPNDELEALREQQEEVGHIPGLLERVLIDVQGVETDEVKKDGTPYTPREMVICNQFAANAATMAFWEAVNRDIRAKNSKKSRGN